MENIISAKNISFWFYLNPVRMILNLWRHRELIWQFTLREIQGRYKGSFMGLFWSFINPLVLLLTYTFVFGIIFKSRWRGTRVDNMGDFALVLFCGLTIFNIFSECATRAPSLILAVPNYVKKVVFPLEILAISALGGALFHSGISLIIIIGGSLLFKGSLPWTLILLPLVLIPLIFLCLGITWFLAGLGVYVRDINYSVTLIVQVLFFVTPIFYPIEIIPPAYQRIVLLNPLTPIVHEARNVMIWGNAPEWQLLGWITLLGLLAMILGYTWFMKARRGFADVI
jgi:lipopolysaccharide transport system permease protein